MGERELEGGGRNGVEVERKRGREGKAKKEGTGWGIGEVLVCNN